MEHGKLDSLYDVTPKFLGELEAWLGQEFFKKLNELKNVPSDSSRASYSNGAGEAIANNTAQSLTWSKTSGIDLLDLTVPTAPTAKRSGKYALTAYFLPTAVLTAGGYFQAQIIMNNAEAQIAERVFQIGTAVFPIKSLTLEWWVDAGSIVQLSVQNKDGASSRTFQFVSYLQFIS